MSFKIVVCEVGAAAASVPPWDDAWELVCPFSFHSFVDHDGYGAVGPRDAVVVLTPTCSEETFTRGEDGVSRIVGFYEDIPVDTGAACLVCTDPWSCIDAPDLGGRACGFDFGDAAGCIDDVACATAFDAWTILGIGPDLGGDRAGACVAAPTIFDADELSTIDFTVHDGNAGALARRGAGCRESDESIDGVCAVIGDRPAMGRAHAPEDENGPMRSWRWGEGTGFQDPGSNRKEPTHGGLAA